MAPVAESAPVRLTRRGVAVLAAATLLVAVVVVVSAWLSAASGAGAATGGSARPVPAVITVQAGDSLWGIAREVAPNRDPRAVIDDLRTLNHLDGDTVTPGQQLRVR